MANSNAMGQKKHVVAKEGNKKLNKVSGEKNPVRGKGFSAEDARLLEEMYKKHKWNAPRMLKEFPSKHWTHTGVKKILQKIKGNDGVYGGRKKGSGRPATACSRINVEKVKSVLESTEGKSARGCSLRDIQIATGIRRTSVQTILKTHLKKKSLSCAKCQKLTEKHKVARLKWAQETLADIQSGKLQLGRVVFSDEKISRCSETKTSVRNNRVWVDEALKKYQLPAEVIAKPVSAFSKGIMTSICVSKMGKFTPVFAEDNCKVKAETYIKMLQYDILPQCKKLAKGKPFAWQQDGATSHTAKKSIHFIKSHFPQSLSWPANSPDCNPLDYAVNAHLEKEIRKTLGDVAKPEDVRAAVLDACENMTQEYIDKVIDSFPKRLQACIDAGGDVFEHTLKRPEEQES